MASFSRFPAIPASPDIGLLNRLLLRTALSFVIGSLLALSFPLLCTHRTESSPGEAFPATGTPGNLLLRCGLSHPRRPSEPERIEQVEAVLWVFVPEPVPLANPVAQTFGQGRQPMKTGFPHPFTSHDPFIPYSLNVLLELLFRHAGLKLPTRRLLVADAHVFKSFN